MSGILSRIREHWVISIIYFLNLVLSLHYYLVLYVNSSFLETTLGKNGISILYIVGSVVSLATFVFTPRALASFGAWKYILLVIAGEFVAVWGLSRFASPLSLATFFVLHQAFSAMVFFSLDVFLEETVREENHTGELRGLYLTMSNLALIVSPLLAGSIIAASGFQKLYLVSALLCIPMFIVAFSSLRAASKKIPRHIKIWETMNALWKNSDVLNVSLAQLVLQLFYAWMVIYMPIYLNQYMHFNWTEIGALFTIMLLPFVLFEIPAGWISDKRLGEQEIMIGGFLISSLAVLAIPFLHNTFLSWAIVLFLSRVGASLVEVTTESYFFKKIDGRDSDLLSIFRMTRSLSYLITPAIVLSVFLLINFQYSFFVLALITLSGILFASRIEDTK